MIPDVMVRFNSSILLSRPDTEYGSGNPVTPIKGRRPSPSRTLHQTWFFHSLIERTVLNMKGVQQYGDNFHGDNRSNRRRRVIDRSSRGKNQRAKETRLKSAAKRLPLADAPDVAEAAGIQKRDARTKSLPAKSPIGGSAPGGERTEETRAEMH